MPSATVLVWVAGLITGRGVCGDGTGIDSQLIETKVACSLGSGPEGTPTSKARMMHFRVFKGWVTLHCGHGSHSKALDTRFGRCHSGTLSFLPSVNCGQMLVATVVTFTL